MNAYSLTSASKNQNGFTLLEILIAITLLAFITIGVVDITDNAAQTKERTTEINANNLQIETAMSRFEWDFSQIYSPLYFSQVMTMGSTNPYGNDVSGSQSGFTDQGTQSGQMNAGTQGGTNPVINSPYAQQYFEQLVQRFQQNEHFMAVSKEGMPIPRFSSPDKSVFEFFTTSNRRKVENQKQSHFAWVRYSLADQEPLPEEEEKNENKVPKGLKSFVRYYAAEDPWGPKKINPDDSKAAVLLRNVEALEFQYWDFQKRKWETSLRNIQSGESLVRGVRILLTWYDNFGNKRTTARIFRTLWPMVTPVDQAQPGVVTASATAGVTAGATAGTNAGATSGTNAGTTAGVNSGMGF